MRMLSDRATPALIWFAFLILLIGGCTTVAPLPLPPALSQTATPTSTRVPLTPTPMPTPTPPLTEVSGVVQNAKGPVAGARVRVQNTANYTLTADDGAFTLGALAATQPVTITAWAAGHYIGWANVVPGPEPITITLEPYPKTDNLDYEWESAAKCSECHTAYAEWKVDAHAQSAINPRFLTMYEGTDLRGNKSPPTRYIADGAEPPDPTQPYYGPGFKIDFPDRAGNCAACHTPLAAPAPLRTCAWAGCHTAQTAAFAEQSFAPQHQHQLEGIDPTGLTGVAAEGITCDFCHKIGNVTLDRETGLPYADRPGILSTRLYRPAGERQLFFGTFDDVTADVDSYLPLLEKSTFCAACHYGVFSAVDGKFGGVEIYNSYGEWLASPYSDPETGQTCQDCHMPTVDYDYFVFPEKGGLRRGSDRIHNHQMRGSMDEALLQNSVTMTTTASLERDGLLVEVSITNDKAGHHVPTGIPLRHLILVIEVTDANGNPVSLREGPVLPDWTGNYAGYPGRYYAKILEDQWTGESPTTAFWREIRVVEDTRIPALATDTSQYIFELPPTSEATVEARLVFRRAYQQLMQWKGWRDPDILMEREQLQVKIDAP